MHDSALSRTKVCKKHGKYSVEVKVPSLFEDQTTSWIKIVNGVEKYVREAMPIQEEERASVKPAAKARPTLKPSSTSKWDFIPDIEVQRSKDPYCFQMSNSLLNYFDTRKLVEKKMPEFLMTELLRNAWKFYQMIQDIGQTKWKKNWERTRIGQRTIGWTFCQKVEDRRKGFNTVWNQFDQKNSCIPSSHSRSFRKSWFLKCSHQFCIARQCTVTKGFYQGRLSRRKRKRIQINSA